MPDEDRWQQIWHVFHGAVERPAGERTAYVEAACRDDSALRDEVLSLLAEHESSDHLLDRGVRSGSTPVSPDAATDRLRRTRASFESHVGQRYRLLNVLGTGGMGEVYRTLDRLTGRVVALKKILSSSGGPETFSTSAETVTAPMTLSGVTRGILGALSDQSAGEAVRRELALAQEFRLLASLRHPHIISVLDYGFDAAGRPYFTMPLLEDAETVIEAAAGAPLDARVDYLSRILQALAYLHRQGVVHRDLKPNNVLVSDGRLKLLDFGISILHAEAESGAAGAAGTLLYMAPEILAGEPASAAADLFAVGVIAYELLAGRHPFGSPQSRLLAPLLDRSVSADLDRIPLPAVRAVLARLLAPSPGDRFSGASQALDELHRAARRPPPVAGGQIRDSFLQAARFVGRDADLARLTRRLAGAISGRGGVRLVAGESGVGKSRLLEELRTLALVEGVLVVRGQAVRYGGSPYQPWRNVVRCLTLGCELSDLEAGSLASLVPDLGELLERQIDTAPELDPQAARDRLRAVIGELFRRQRSAALVILEDLHWADSESLELLARLDRLAAGLPLLILGSFRDDELSELPGLDAIDVLRLKRLDEGAVAELCQSMLGATRARPEMVELLARETEGNAFFLVEAVRALAEGAGGLDRIATMTLPEQIAAGGIRRVVRRRLERVPPEARPLLRQAAVAGRQLNLDVLVALAPEVELEDWLTACAAASVLEIEDDAWRFQHDKLREGVLEGIAAAELPALHRRVALAIESLPVLAAASSAALAHHWAMAGDGERTRHATERAGREALANGAHQDAIRWLGQAIELHQRHGAPQDHVGSLERQLALAYYSLGRLVPTRDHLLRALALLGRPAPSSRFRLGAGLLAQVLLQSLHRTVPDRLWPRRPAGRGHWGRRIEAVRGYRLLCELNYITGRPLPLVHAMLRALNLAEGVTRSAPREAGDGDSLLASVYGACATVLGLILRPLGPIYVRRAHAAAARGRHPPDVAYTFLATSAFYLGIGAFAEAAADLERGGELYRQVGDGRRWGQIVAWQAAVAELRGELEQCREYARLICDSSERRGDANTRAYGLTYRASMALLRGAPQRAAELCREALDGLEGNIDRVEEKRARGLLARAHLARGDADAAWLEAEQAAHLSAGSPPTMPHSLTGYASLAEVTLALWQRALREGDGEDAGRLALAARRAVRELERYARRFPVGRPRALLARGRLAWIDGSPAAARRAGREALSTARALGMPLEEALAHGQLGRHLEAGEARAEHCEQASNLLAKLGVRADWR